MTPDPAQALEPFRSYLEVLARVHLDPRLRGKVEPADVVQQVLLRACAAWPELKAPDRPSLPGRGPVRRTIMAELSRRRASFFRPGNAAGNTA
jgi:hypothetical protein